MTDVRCRGRLNCFSGLYTASEVYRMDDSAGTSVILHQRTTGAIRRAIPPKILGRRPSCAGDVADSITIPAPSAIRRSATLL